MCLARLRGRNRALNRDSQKGQCEKKKGLKKGLFIGRKMLALLSEHFFRPLAVFLFGGDGRFKECECMLNNKLAFSVEVNPHISRHCRDNIIDNTRIRAVVFFEEANTTEAATASGR